MADVKATPLPDAKSFYSNASRIGSKEKSVGWYDKDFSGTPADACQLLQSYAGIHAGEVDSHVLSIRDKAWDIYPYPCIGQFKFLTLSLYKQPSYESMVRRLKSGSKYLDIGCCLGQDIRKLVADGAPPESVHGAELTGPFIELSYELFRDRESGLHLFQADALALSDDGPLGRLKGDVDFIHLGMVVHVFGLDEQRALFENCISLLRPQRGSLLLGTAVGDVEGAQAPAGHFMHSDETFRAMWRDIQERTGVQFDCRVSLDDGLGIPAAKKQHGYDRARRLVFEVERL